MLALLGAVFAAVAYGTATILQAIGVQRLAAAPVGASVLDRARLGRLYGAGLALDGLGFLLSIAALQALPLFVVESMLASSVGVTALLAVLLLHQHLTRSEVLALVVAGIGLVLLAISAQEGPARAIGTVGGRMMLGGAIVVCVVFAAGLADRRQSRASVTLAVAAGLGFGLTGIAARGLRISDPWWHTLTLPALWALALGGIVAVVAYGFALDRGRTTTVAAITFAVETVIPAWIGLGWLGDTVRPGFATVALLGFVATLGGCLALAGRAEVDA